ncbi:response regulator [Candidatus Sumerlaeota bacterium]|nr:response regulator [Candidatus Sumerlaeota bacterium]
MKDATVLVVDDDPDLVKLLQTTLVMRGHRVVTASDGREALVRLEEGHIDTIVLDLLMPVMGGLETLEHLRANPRTRQIPVLVVSAIGQAEEAIVNALNAGANDFMSKPYDPPELLRRIDVMVNLHRLHSERSRAVRELAGAASHQLSQPLTSLMGHLELLVAHIGRFSAEDAEHLRVAQAAAFEVSEVVRRLQRVEGDSTVPYISGTRIIDLDGQGEPSAGAPYADEYSEATGRPITPPPDEEKEP